MHNFTVASAIDQKALGEKQKIMTEMQRAEADQVMATMDGLYSGILDDLDHLTKVYYIQYIM